MTVNYSQGYFDVQQGGSHYFDLSAVEVLAHVVCTSDRTVTYSVPGETTSTYHTDLFEVFMEKLVADEHGANAN